MKSSSKHRAPSRRCRFTRRLNLENLEMRALMAADFTPLQNPVDPEDVNNDESVSPIDALICIDRLNADQAAQDQGPPDQAFLFHDVNGDGLLSPADALAVIDRMNASDSAASEGAGRRGGRGPGLPSGPTRPEAGTTTPSDAPRVPSLDGTGNNPFHPEWGSTDENLLRRTRPDYADGVSSPAGDDRPSAREISNALSEEGSEERLNDRHMTAMVYAWGQFLDHDISLTPGASPSEPFNIPVPEGDSEFDPTGTGTQVIRMNRSQFDSATGLDTTTGSRVHPRQQVNTITAFVDASQVYGSDDIRAAALRTFSGGQLKIDSDGLLPTNDAGLPNANDAHRVPDDQLFLAGDVRANENIELTSMHTLFVREHNRLAAEIASKEPALSDEQLYQRARLIVMGEIQAITYHEFLPALLGQDALRPYRGYNPNVNPGINNEFSTAAFRVGHTMLGDDIEFLDNDGNEVQEPLDLRDAFFNPDALRETNIDPILKYLATDNAREVDTRVVDDVRNFLFGPPGAGGFDLASLNIQRGRDHGLADYNSTREAYGLRRVTSFDQITSDTETQAKLQEVYGSVDKIDLWVGGLAEDHVAGASVGPTFRRIIADQFMRLRDGDSFWYQNVLQGETLRQVDQTTLADVIRRNTDITNLQANVFLDETAQLDGSIGVPPSADPTAHSHPRPGRGASSPPSENIPMPRAARTATNDSPVTAIGSTPTITGVARRSPPARTDLGGQSGNEFQMAADALFARLGK